MLERRAGPDDVRRAFYTLRDAGFDNISLDLIYGIPGQSAADLDATSTRRSRSSPSTCPATSSRRSRGRASRTPAGTSSRARPRRWRATSSGSSSADRRRLPLVRDGELLPRPSRRRRDLRSRHNLAYWLGRDYLGLGIGAVSTVGGVRWRNAPRLAALPRGARGGRRAAAGARAARRATCSVASGSCSACGSTSRSRSRTSRRRSTRTRSTGSSSLGLALDAAAAATLALTPRGRFLGGGVTAELLA